MRYVISDIHGYYGLFTALMKKIGFSDKDELYICGDIIDKGMESVRLLRHVASMPNVHAIRGNHEEAFLQYYSRLMSDTDDYDAVLDELRRYFKGDGALLTWELVDYLEGLPYYIEREDFICVHAGVPLLNDGRLAPLDTAEPKVMLYDRRFRNPDVLPRESKTVFFGHTSLSEPRFIAYARVDEPGCIGDFIKIQLDVGTFDTGVLGCFCIDNCTAYYVTRSDTEG